VGREAQTGPIRYGPAAPLPGGNPEWPCVEEAASPFPVGREAQTGPIRSWPRGAAPGRKMNWRRSSIVSMGPVRVVQLRGSRD